MELLAEGRTEFLKGHMVWSDKAICCSASSRRKVAGVGFDVRGEGGSLRIPFAGVWRD